MSSMRRENEQWQEVTSKKSQVKLSKLVHESLLSVEASPRKVIEVNDTWVNIRATMDSGAAGHVMPAEMFPASETGSHECIRNSLQQMEKRIKDLVKKPYHSSPWKECTGA